MFRPLYGIEGEVDVVPMVEAFRLAFSNLQEIWSLVLAPNSLLGLKRLSVVDPSAFRMTENLWARIVFDFLVAWRLRTLNRGHLAGRIDSSLSCMGGGSPQRREIGHQFRGARGGSRRCI